MSAQPQVSALFRRLLVKVHPDVVASQSERFRAHNEATLKVLMSCLDEQQQEGAATTASPPPLHTKISFYLRDGGKTATVKFNRRNPLITLQALLGELPPNADAQEDKRGGGAKSAKTDSNKDELKRDEVREIWQHALDHWWNNRVRSVDNMELLFQQNRIRFLPDYADWKARVDPKMEHKFAIESALSLVKTVFDIHVADTTLDALVEAPELRRIELRIVGKNLYKPTIRERSILCVPLGCPPEVMARELDALVDGMVRDIVEAEEEKARNGGPSSSTSTQRV